MPGARVGGRALTALPLPQFLCTLVAIALHYVYMSTFAWTFVESLHVYRMLTEARNIDAGPMRFYHVLGWGLPAVVTGEAGAWRALAALPPAAARPLRVVCRVSDASLKKKWFYGFAFHPQGSRP